MNIFPLIIIRKKDSLIWLKIVYLRGGDDDAAATEKEEEKECLGITEKGNWKRIVV